MAFKPFAQHGELRASPRGLRYFQHKHRIREWFGLEGTLKIIWFQPPGHEQGHLPPAQGAQSSIQPGLEPCQGGGSHSSSGQPGPVIQLSLSHAGFCRGFQKRSDLKNQPSNTAARHGEGCGRGLSLPCFPTSASHWLSGLVWIFTRGEAKVVMLGTARYERQEETLKKHL